ncbi:hypothetical protein Prudu_005572, partial [Prunus dulcis]
STFDVKVDENGGVFASRRWFSLSDFEDFSEPDSGVFEFKRLKVPWDIDDGSGSSRNYRWLSCEFSWHPRVLIVARSDAVFLVDLRAHECNVSCLMKIEMLHMYAFIEKEQFLVLSKAGSDDFHFVLASDTLLVVCDVRKPLMPVLQWAHGLDKPSYVDVLRLSELRSQSRDDKFNWASDSGFCIIAGSFWNCEFSIFCYGPSLPAPIGSVASKIAELRKSFYAWELPSDLLLSGHECHCGSCLVKEEFSKDALPEWIDWQQKKEIVLGFGIVNKDLSALLSEPDEFGVDEEYKFPRTFKYLKLDYLCGYLNGNLDEVLDDKIKIPYNDQGKELFSSEFHETLCKKLDACGFGKFRSSPAVTSVLNDISLPASIHEVVLKRLWSDLPIELLQLAFSNNSEILEVLVDKNRVALEFSVVPDLSQLPPFILRKSSCRSNKWSQKVQPGDALVGPVLPLPVLLALHEYRNGCPNSDEKSGRFSVEAEINRSCDEVMQVTGELAVSISEAEIVNNPVTSLANDGDETWRSSQKSKPFFSYQPVAAKGSHWIIHRANLFIRMTVSDKKHVSNGNQDNVGLELFDDLCPVELRFDASSLKFEQKELEAYSKLKGEFLKWQKSFDLPKDLPRIARTAGRLAGRSIGYVQLARGQFDNVMQQSQAHQVHKELQDAFAQLESIRYEVRSISLMNPGPMARRLMDNPQDPASLSDCSILSSHTLLANWLLKSSAEQENLKDESGLFIVLPISAESTGMLPNRKVVVMAENVKGTDIVLEALVEAEVARNAKDFFSQPENQIHLHHSIYNWVVFDSKGLTAMGCNHCY